MLETNVLEYLIDRISLGIYNYNQLKFSDIDDIKYSSVLKIVLFALIALEKFAHTSESKHILFQSLTIKNEQTKMNVLEYYEPWTLSKNCLKQQIGKKKIFCKNFICFFLSKRFLCSMVT